MWSIIYLFCTVAWASGMFVLFRNQRSNPTSAGDAHVRSGFSDNCAGIELVLGAGVEHAFLLLLEVTLDGGDIWDCSSQSAYQVPECKALERGVLVSPLASSSLMAHPNACY
jgi:hypothetical protein